MKSVEYSEHAKIRLRLRGVRKRQVTEVISQPDRLYRDTESNAMIAVKEVKERHLIVIYAAQGTSIRVVTLYYASQVDRLISRKVTRGVWTAKA